MANRDVIVGVASGTGAIAALLICAFPMGMAALPSILVAALVGGAILLVAPGGLLGPRTKPNEQEARAIAAAKGKIESMLKGAQSLPAERSGGKRNVSEIAAEAGRILKVIESDPNKFAMAEIFLNQCITPIESVVSQYVTLSVRGLATAKDFLVDVEDSTLPKFKLQIAKWYEQIHLNDVAKLMGSSIDAEAALSGVNLETGEKS